MSEGIKSDTIDKNKRPALCLNLGKTNYKRALELQYDLVDAKLNKTIEYDRILVTQHFPTFTLGKNGGLENLVCSKDFLESIDIEVIQTTRGGNITFHGPGQIVLYPIVDLNALKIDVPTFVNKLEQVMILTCKNFGINVDRNKKNPGIWVNNSKANSKLGNIGICLKKGISFHGLSLNVNLDLTPFSWINPCGLNDVEITSIENELLKANKNQKKIKIEDVTKQLVNNFESVFNYQLKHKHENTMPGINQAKKSIKPTWFKRNLPDNSGFEKVRNILKKEKLNTVCEGANCPNKWECFCSGTSTFLILGNQCTRTCKFCNIESGNLSPADPDEPQRVANAVHELKLNYVVLTSVTRDDLPDGGAAHFAQTIAQIRNKMGNNIKIEVLIPDFKGDKDALKTVLDMKPDVLNHNIETVPSLYKKARPEADYNQSLQLLSNSLKINGSIPVKSGIMVGLGETYNELSKTIVDLFKTGCSMLTIGQYLQPSKAHLPVQKYYCPEEFSELETFAKNIGFREVASGPFVRSSYKAEKLLN